VLEIGSKGLCGIIVCALQKRLRAVASSLRELRVSCISRYWSLVNECGALAQRRIGDVQIACRLARQGFSESFENKDNM